MILNLGSLAFNAETQTPGGSPAWGTELGQGEGYKFVFEDMSDFFTGMVYKSVVDTENVTCPLGKGGNQRNDYDFVIASLFDKIYVNGKRVNNARFLLLVVKKLVGEHHVGRRTIKYNPRMTYRGEYVNEDCYRKMVATMGWAEDAAWFVYEIFIKNQDELHFTAFELGEEPQSYRDNDERKNAFLSRLPKDGKRTYEIKSSKPLDQPLQQIFYGAPGTGKSYKIKTDVEEANRIYFRTTFHPDSDYSTFVGCYKPTMNKVRGYDEEGYIENEGMTRDGENHEPETKGEIIYSFTPQAFTNAYIKAWQVEEPVFLIIEEINRGNCAQIFGDLFQLLDRDEDGYSQYKVDADKDLADHIREKLGNAHKEDTPEYIYKGEEIKLQLPNNLYIWATMNTSDQSLFPIDSAFKRRWEWVYRPIAEGEGKYEIEGQGGNSWWKFIQGINEVIDTTTHSEDKKLGYYFCKPAKKDSKIITKKTFVNKVVFYLWNDVFKVYGFKSDIFDKEADNNQAKKITFKDFYKDDGEVNDDTIKTFVQKVMAKALKAKTQIDEENQQGEQNETQTEA